MAGNRDGLIGESADVLYHLLVMWVNCGVEPEAVWGELERREGVSGIAEKARPRQAAGDEFRDPQDPVDSETRGISMPVDGLDAYDDQNIFAKLLRGEIPSRRVYEDAFAVAFHDIAPQAKLHVLVIPRGRYVSLADFTRDAPDAEIAGFFRAVGAVARALGLEAPGYRALANMGADGGQEVPHFHVHLFGGEALSGAHGVAAGVTIPDGC